MFVKNPGAYVDQSGGIPRQTQKGDSTGGIKKNLQRDTCLLSPDKGIVRTGPVEMRGAKPSSDSFDVV